MNDLVVAPEWLEALAEEAKALISESLFNASWTLIQGYHDLGSLICNDENFQKFRKGNGEAVKVLAHAMGMSYSTVYRSIQFYEKYPDLNELPGGKNITWNRIVTNLLPTAPGRAADHSAWTKTKFLLTLDLEGLSRSLQNSLQTWRTQTNELYDRVLKERDGE